MPDASAARDVDRHVGARISERRAMLGLTQRQVAGLLGVTCHQLHKYEIGFNRVSAGRLHRIAEALGVGPAYFFEDLGAERPPGPRRRMALELARHFVRLPSRRHQEAIAELARALVAEPVSRRSGRSSTGVSSGCRAAQPRPVTGRCPRGHRRRRPRRRPQGPAG